jgi:hypothetical protein
MTSFVSRPYQPILVRSPYCRSRTAEKWQYSKKYEIRSIFLFVRGGTLFPPKSYLAGVCGFVKTQAGKGEKGKACLVSMLCVFFVACLNMVRNDVK